MPRAAHPLRNALVTLAKAAKARPGSGDQQLQLFAPRPTPPGGLQQVVQVRQHIARDRHGGHVVAAHSQHRAPARPAPPPLLPTPAERFADRGLDKLQRAATSARHPELRRHLLALVQAAARHTDSQSRAVALAQTLDELRAADSAPARVPVLARQQVADRLAEGLRRERNAWEADAIPRAVVAQRERLKDRAQLHPLYQGLGAPRPGERGYQPAVVAPANALDGRAVSEVAQTMLGHAIDLYDDPDVGTWLAEGGDEDVDYPDPDQLDALADGAAWSRADLADLLDVPRAGPDGRLYDSVKRLAIAQDTFALAGQVRGEGGGANWTDWRELRTAGLALPREFAEVVIEDALQPQALANPAPRIVVLDKQTTADFIDRHHSKLERANFRGVMYTIGLSVGGRLVAVATAGAPGGRYADPHRILDVTRIASDRTFKGASSMLMARLMDLVDRSRRPGAKGPNVLVTYSLVTEAGHTYRALREKGLRPVEIVLGKGGGGSRASDDASQKGVDKLRWEYGPGARAADWGLLDKVGTGATA